MPGGPPQPNPSPKGKQRAEPSSDDAYGLEATLASHPEENDLAAFGLKKIVSSSIQGQNTTKPSAGISDNPVPSKAVSEAKLQKLCDKAINTPKHYKWRDEHTRFLQAYIDTYQDPRNEIIDWEPMKSTYKRFWDFYGEGAVLSKASKIKQQRLDQVPGFN